LLKIKANAKINLFLDITGRRDNGYHDLDMIMQSVDLGDVLTFERSSETIIHEDAQPLAGKAAAAFFSAAKIEGGITVNIEKNIPFEAGLGGMSATCAATLYALNELYSRPLSKEQLLSIACSLGADVPFTLFGGGCCHAKGIGEELEFIENNMDCWFLLLQPQRGISTKCSFELYDAQDTNRGGDIDACIAALHDNDIDAFRRNMWNALRRPSEELCPDVYDTIAYLRKTARAAFMTGSGSACVGIYDSLETAQAAEQAAEGYRFKCIARKAATGLEVMNA